jgi:hypothetical protein
VNTKFTKNRRAFRAHRQSLLSESSLSRKPGLVVIATVFVLMVFLLEVPQSYAASNVNISIGPDRSAFNVGMSSAASPVSTIYSYNWAGYALSAASGTVTEAQGSWIQPATKCSSTDNGDQYAAFWVGVDGYTSTTVEQTGTLSYCPQGSVAPEYIAWYEFYPAQAIEEISTMTIHAGDKIQAMVKYSATKKTISVTLKDVTDGQSFTTSNPSGFTFLRSSAECITETPSTGSGLAILANFGSVSWGKDYTMIKNTCSATVSGSTKPIGNFGANSVDIIMCSSLPCTGTAIMAMPSSISKDGTSFKVAFENAGP